MHAAETYQPSSILTIHKLLRVRPLVQKVVRCIELGGERELAIPNGSIPRLGIFLNIIPICNRSSLGYYKGEGRANRCQTHCRGLSGMPLDQQRQPPAGDTLRRHQEVKQDSCQHTPKLYEEEKRSLSGYN